MSVYIVYALFVNVSVGCKMVAATRRVWYAIVVAATVLSFSAYLLPKYWSPSENKNPSPAEPGAAYQSVSPESQPDAYTSLQPSPGQRPRLVSSDPKGRIRANKTRSPVLSYRDKALAVLQRAHGTYVQTRLMPRDRINFTAHQNGAIRPPSPQNRRKKKPEPKLSVCDPNERTNAAALGFQPLSQSVVEGVEKFVFFVGYQRSGHSIIGGVMDAHPDIVIAHEYFLFSKCESQLKAGANIFDNKIQLFNDLYENSYLSSKCGWRSASNTSKGYNLDVGGQWQGTFRQLRVIGDKSGGRTTTRIMESLGGKECLDQMMKSFNMPIIAVHVVRNPYDMIATNILYKLSTTKNTKASDELRKARPDLDMLVSNTNRVFSQALAVAKVSKKLIVVEIHIEDYIKDPRSCVLEICRALEVSCPQDYVEECYQKAYRNVSRSRDLIEWEPVVLHRIRQKMKAFPFFRGYTFEDDFRL